MRHVFGAAVLVVMCFATPICYGQEEAGSGELNQEAKPAATDDFVSDARDKVGEIAKQVDQSAQAKEVSAGILQPIYLLAENMAFPMFHWVAFALMTAGVISFALQLVLGKLVVLAKMSFSVKAILGDALGLVISLIGLVLTTQAAAENSTFTTSPAAVLSAAGIGAVLGLIFYWWGQSEEVQAALGRRIANKP